MVTDRHLLAFDHLVKEKYRQYDQLFLELPFANIPIAGKLLPIFSKFCAENLSKGLSPDNIVTAFFDQLTDINTQEEQIGLLFVFLQFIERQVVLFDALEENAFARLHDMDGPGTITSLSDNTQIPEGYKTRVVLTAHPTQFYSKHILHIISELSKAIRHENAESLQKILLQLGKTPFLSNLQPTPLDEVDLLLDYLKNVFYPTISTIHYQLCIRFNSNSDFIKLGFWPGSDRDGNPNVTDEITRQVAKKLKSNILNLYINDIKELQYRLTFKNITEPLSLVREKLEETLQKVSNGNVSNYYSNADEFLNDLQQIKTLIKNQHNSLFIEPLLKLISSVHSFGFYFASMDLRQDSRVHSETIAALTSSQYLMFDDQQKESHLINILNKDINLNMHSIDALNKDVIQSLQSIPVIQNDNGENGLNRYIISNTHKPYHMLEILALSHIAGLNWQQLNFDIIPLFESVADLANAEATMQSLWQSKIYQQHLRHRGKQVIMLGFSDGTKDGGYIKANWSIFNAKQTLSNLAAKMKVPVIFFDGRGGPPARGGGNTHLFYRAQPENTTRQIQLTVQGQTISSNYGTPTAAKFNLEQLFTAGLEKKSYKFTDDDQELLQQLADISYLHYHQLKDHPQFFNYLKNITPLELFGELNIASRPPKRGRSTELTLDDLRAIPFVGAWSQMKQNIPGYYGVGTALQQLIEDNLQHLRQLYQQSLFFRTLLDNAAQSLSKSFFPLTQYLADDPQYGEFWQLLSDEAKLSEKMILKISQQDSLLANDPVIKASIQLREQIVQPLQVIQQYALIQLRKNDGKQPKDRFKKLVLKSIGTNINASRNSA